MFFPIFINLRNKECLVIGGGKVALRKINKIVKYEGDITVISKSFIDKIKILSKDGRVKIIEGEFKLDDENVKMLKNYFLVIAATDDKELNDGIASVCIKENILVNNATSKNNMNVKFCCHIENAEYSIGISANSNPNKALKIKRNIEFFLNNREI